MPILLDLFLTFLKVGAVSFGGGYGMISILSEEVVSHGYLTGEEFLNFVAVSESTPGPIAINMATFVGASQAGFWGAVLCTLGVVLPAFIVILLVVTLIKGLMKFAGVQGVLSGIRPVVVGLIIGTGIYMVLTVVFGFLPEGFKFSFDYKAGIIFAVNCVVYLVYKKIKGRSVSPILLIILSALLGMLFYGVIA